MNKDLKTARTPFMSLTRLLALGVLISLFSGCSITKNIPQDAKLYLQPKVTLADSLHQLDNTQQRQIKDLPEPKANKRFLGLFPFRVWLYQLAPDTVGEKGLGNWLKNKAGKAPVLFNPQSTTKSQNRIQGWLFNRGYFEASVTSSLIQKENSVRPHYKVYPRAPYLIDTIIYTATLKGASLPMPASQELLFIKPNTIYRLDALQKERIRLAEMFQNKGYFYFYEDYLRFQIDTSFSKKKLDLYVTLAKETPEKAFSKYRIAQIDVYPNYRLEKQDVRYDTLITNGVRYLRTDHNLHPSLISNSIQLKPGEYYSQEAYQSTLNKLMGLVVLKFANIKFRQDRAKKTDSMALVMDAYLTQKMPVSTRAEVQVVTKSNDFSGPLLRLSYVNRNLNGGAENLQIELNGGFESQWSGRGENYLSYELGSAFKYSLPRFLFPYIDLNRFLGRRYTPKTDFMLEYTRINRTNYYTSNALETSFGYRWQETANKFHNLKLLTLNYHKVFNTSSQFDEMLENDPLLQESFREKFMLGSNYQYTYTPPVKDKFNIYYIGFSADIAGNLLHLFDNLMADESGNSSGALFGLPYSQYAKATGDVRTRITGNSRIQLVNRTFVGLGLPYGNSSSLPHSKQFFVGGANSLRGFQFRSLGPGATPEETYNNLFVHSGNLKFETSIELRFPIAGIVKSALFLDAGNIWLWENTTSQPNAGFSPEDLYKELAVNTGIGFRLDIALLVLRLDLGVPLRIPYTKNGNQWIAFRPFQKEWIRQHPVINIAIGYPF